MSLSPEQIATRRFVVALRGYDKDEVDSFLTEIGEQVAELLQTAPDPAAPGGTQDDPLARFGQQIESVLRSAVAAADAIRGQVDQEVAALRASAIGEAQQRRDEAERAVAQERDQWERERQQMASDLAAARQQAEREIEESKAAASEALRAAQGVEATASELRESASRELANAQAYRVAAEEEASAVMVRAAEEAERYRQEMIDRLQKSLSELSAITSKPPSLEFNAESVSTSSQSEATGDQS